MARAPGQGVEGLRVSGLGGFGVYSFGGCWSLGRGAYQHVPRNFLDS